jgi:hypothetical protein
MGVGSATMATQALVKFEDFEALCDRLFDEDIDGDADARLEWFRKCFLKLKFAEIESAHKGLVKPNFADYGFHSEDIVITIWKFLQRGENIDEAYVLISEIIDNIPHDELSSKPLR